MLRLLFGRDRAAGAARGRREQLTSVAALSIGPAVP